MSNEMQNNAQGKERMANMELLRCVAMLMVAALHFLGKGNILPPLAEEGLGPAGAAAWLLESFCIVAVNLYMFISGYFLCTSSFKLSRLAGLWFQVWLYSVTLGAVGILTGIMPGEEVDIHLFLTLLFPISMDHYWFMTAYVILYLLFPFLGAAVKKMTKRQLQTAVILLFLAFCLPKSILPLRLEIDNKGYDFLWYLCVFAAAAYVRRFGIPFLEKKGRGVLLYVCSCLLIFGCSMGLRLICLRTGRLETRVGMFMEYNHILPFLGAAGLFAAFYRLRISGAFARLVNRIAPYTLGVYLLHENISLRYAWQEWMGAGRIHSVAGVILGTAAAAAGVFVCGVLVDMLRGLLLKGLDRLFSGISIYRRQKDAIKRVDTFFSASEG